MNDTEREAKIKLLKQVKDDPDLPYLWLTNDYGFNLLDKTIADGQIQKNKSGQCRITQAGLSELGDLQAPVKPAPLNGLNANDVQAITKTLLEPNTSSAAGGLLGFTYPDTFKTKILNALAGGALTLRQIADSTGISSVQVKISLERMFKNYEVKQIAQGNALVWALPDEDSAQATGELEPDVGVQAAIAMSKDLGVTKLEAAFQTKFGMTNEPKPGSSPNGKRNVTQEIIALLSEVPKTSREFAELVGISVKDAAATLQSIFKRGFAQRLEREGGIAWIRTVDITQPPSKPKAASKPTMPPEQPQTDESKITQRQLVIEALTLEPEAYTVIAERCGLPAKRVSGVLTRLADSRDVKKHRTPEGLRWSMPGGVLVAPKTPQTTLETPEMPIMAHAEPHEVAEATPEPNAQDDFAVANIKRQVLEVLNDGNSSIEWLRIRIAAKPGELDHALEELRAQGVITKWGIEGTENVGYSLPEAVEITASSEPEQQQTMPWANDYTAAEMMLEYKKQPEPNIDPRAISAFNEMNELQAIASCITALSPLAAVRQNRAIRYLYDLFGDANG